LKHGNRKYIDIFLQQITGNFFISGILWITIFLGCSFGSSGAASVPDSKRLTFVFYNVENLFDTQDDPAVNDREYLPGGEKHWNFKRYIKKINDISRVIKELGDSKLPEVIGLCEVENEMVLSSLVNHANLRGGHYKIVHFNDRDSRGIDLALIYRSDEFFLLSKVLIPVRSSKGGIYARGILYVTLRSGNGEIFHIYVNHWPSREDNDAAKERGRQEMARALRQLTDASRVKNKNANMVIMGDMNDEPGNMSLSGILGAVKPGSHARSGLVNLMFPAQSKGEGSVKFRNDWQMLDNLIVSESLLDNQGYRVEGNRGFVFSEEWMKFRTRKGQVSPDRTYVGNKYTGGVSDHFPVYFRLIR